MKKQAKLAILGHARHGKDTCAELLRDNFNFKFLSSSQAAADIFIYDALKEKYGYTTPLECFEDRMNHRAEWYNMICEYNKENRTKLASHVLEITDCYVGMRDKSELTACVNADLFDVVIWVDASDRLPAESLDSCNIDKTCADFIIENNGTLEEFTKKVIRIGKIILN